MARDKYEISLWEDVLVEAQISGSTITAPAHFEERKIVVIGSDTMTDACRAYEPKLVENINGTNTFTFKMFYVYRDELTGEKRQNPFLNLLTNERKIKVKWKGKWYDLVIKNIQEDSSGKSVIYTCKDLFINELSKNGFDLEFDNELENNQGTVTELAAKVLEGTDWQLDTTNSDSIKQEKEEPVYEVLIKSGGITAINQTTGASGVSIAAGKKVLLFYSCVQESSSPCQFLYDPAQEYPRDTNSQLVIGVDCYSFNGTYSNITSSSVSSVSNNYRGSRLVNSQKSVLDPVTDKYVKVYEATGGSRSTDGYKSGDEIYGYTSTEYKDPTFVNSLVINAKNFASTNGWIGVNSAKVGPFQLYPLYSSGNISNYSAKSYLRLAGGGTFYNTGLRESGSYIPNGIQKGEEYIFRFKAMTDNNGPSGTYISSTSDQIVPHIYKYQYVSGVVTPTTTTDYITRLSFSLGDNNWIECTCTCAKSFSRNQVYSENIGLFFTVTPNCWIEEVEFFPFVMGEVSIDETTFNANKTTYYTYNINTKMYIRCTNSSQYSSTTSYYKRINPGEMDSISVATTYYHYYNHTTHSGVISIDDYLYVGTTDWNKTNVSAVSNDFSKIRSITAKESNRFNLLQSLAETFECWCQFEIKHDSTGKTQYVNGVPQKFVRFKKEIGQETGIGFVYGIDLKTISRTIVSDQIVTKTIVKANNNEFGTNGFCTIARSSENYTRDNFILNFDYYISQGLLDGDNVNRDLYSWFQYLDSSGATKGSVSKGYFLQLRELNIEYDQITDLLIQRNTELTKQESYKTVYENYLTSLQEEKSNLESSIMSLAGATTWAAALSYIQANPDQTEIATRMNSRQNCISNIANYQSMLTKITASIDSLTELITAKKDRQKEITTALKELNYGFFKKYSTFIQEGSWINEEYVDDTLYYLDAQSVAYTSSRPQISYNISVARLSSLEEFKNKIFHLGDISFIQDVEFFGYVPGSYPKTPYKEKVLISEVISNFDDPIQDSFKVQNYKTQFEDLFQRITATTQSLQYASGEYNKVAAVIEPTGVIKQETLQNSIAYSNNLVIEANNEQIFQDSTGITVTDATNPNKRTKITSGGVFISTDGGATWKNAIRGEGIATQYLTAGNINVQNITLLDGAYQTFRWDSTGINAYVPTLDENDNIIGVDLSKAVRFDHYGIYGIDVSGDAGSFIPSDEDDIWDTAKFGMTWNGFFVKNKYGDHYVEVSSTNDIQVVDTSGSSDIVRVKIGELENDVYGLRLKDSTGTTTLETSDSGYLWLKDQLHIGTTSSGFSARIGYLPEVIDASKQINYTGTTTTINLDTRVSGTSDTIHRSLDINNNFIVWEDGTMYAKDGYFEGTINATDGHFEGSINATSGTFSGTISANTIIAEGAHVGEVTMGEIKESAYHVLIESSNGEIFKNNEIHTVLTATLYRGATAVTTGTTGISAPTYQWYESETLISGATSRTYTVNATSLSDMQTLKYSCQVTYGG